MLAYGVTELGGDVTRLAQPDPPAPAWGQVLVAVQAAGVGRWDALVASGGWDVGLRVPAALGVEGAGVVAAVGEGAGWTVGELVLVHEAPMPGGSGFWAERTLVSAGHLTARPAALDVVDAAALPVAGLTARQALDRLGTKARDRLLITGGAGGTGAVAVQLAARDGVEVVATASSQHVDRLRLRGAADVVNYHKPDWPVSAGGPFDAAWVAAAGTARAALALVRDGGALCSLTSDAPPGERGVTTSDLYVVPDADALRRLADLVVIGDLVLEPVAQTLDQAPAALRRLQAGCAGGAKLVLTV